MVTSIINKRIQQQQQKDLFLFLRMMLSFILGKKKKMKEYSFASNLKYHLKTYKYVNVA